MYSQEIIQQSNTTNLKTFPLFSLLILEYKQTKHKSIKLNNVGYISIIDKYHDSWFR